MKAQPKDTSSKADVGLSDGRWFKLSKDSFSEARLIEVVIRDGKAVEQTSSVDLSRIQLGKLVRRIGETFAEGK